MVFSRVSRNGRRSAVHGRVIVIILLLLIFLRRQRFQGDHSTPHVVLIPRANVYFRMETEQFVEPGKWECPSRSKRDLQLDKLTIRRLLYERHISVPLSAPVADVPVELEVAFGTAWA